MEVRTSRSDYTVGVLKDGDARKRHPNSIVAVIRGIVSHWESVKYPRSERQNGSAMKFLVSTDFLKKYYSVLDRFDAIKTAAGIKNRADTQKSLKATERMLNNLGAESKQAAIGYHQIRAYADFAGISDASYLSFAKLCSLERRTDGDSEEFLSALDEYISGEIAFLENLRIQAHDTSSFEGFTFDSGKSRRTGKPIWIADAASLKSAAQAQSPKRMKTYRTVMDRK